MARPMLVYLPWFCAALVIAGPSQSPVTQYATSNCDADAEGVRCESPGSRGDLTALLQRGLGLSENPSIEQPDVAVGKQDKKDEDLSRDKLLQKVQLSQAKLALSSSQSGSEKLPDFKELANRAVTSAVGVLNTAVNVTLSALEVKVDALALYTASVGKNLSTHMLTIGNTTQQQQQWAGLKTELQAAFQGLDAQLKSIIFAFRGVTTAIQGGLAASGQGTLAQQVNASMTEAAMQLIAFSEVVEAANERVGATTVGNASIHLQAMHQNLKQGIEKVHAFIDEYKGALDKFVDGVLAFLKPKLPEAVYTQVSEPFLLLNEKGRDILHKLSEAIDQSTADILKATEQLRAGNGWSTTQALGVAALAVFLVSGIAWAFGICAS